MHPKQKAILELNSYPNDLKNQFWLDNTGTRVYKSCEKDGSLEYNWYYFKIHDIWMCRAYDWEQMRDGEGCLSMIIFTDKKEDFNNLKMMESPETTP